MNEQAATDEPGGGESSHRPDAPGGGEDSTRSREHDAVDSVTSEQLGDGVRRTTHGELEPDPYPDAGDADDSGDDVIERHRRHADDVEHPEPGDVTGDTDPSGEGTTHPQR